MTSLQVTLVEIGRYFYNGFITFSSFFYTDSYSKVSTLSKSQALGRDWQRVAMSFNKAAFKLDKLNKGKK